MFCVGASVLHAIAMVLRHVKVFKNEATPVDA